MSNFDPDVFLNTQVNQANETRMTPIPVGEYMATIKDLKYRNPKDDMHLLDIIYDLQPSPELEALGLKAPVCRGSMFIDLDESGAIKFGKNTNVALGRLREAVGQNQDGRPWSPMMLVGAGPVRVSIEQRADKDDPSIIYAEVKSIAKAR